MNKLVKVFLVILAAAVMCWIISIIPVPHPWGIILIVIVAFGVVLFCLSEAGVLGSSS